jgi:hypothetical protein
MEPVEKITLPNGLVVEIYDRSRPIARDTVHVRMDVRMEVPLEERFFDDPARYRETTALVGPAPAYAYRKERTFTPAGKAREVFEELLEDFRKDILPYLGNPRFAERFARAKQRETEAHRIRGGGLPGEGAGDGDEGEDLETLLRKQEESSGGGKK